MATEQVTGNSCAAYRGLKESGNLKDEERFAYKKLMSSEQWYNGDHEKIAIEGGA